MTRCHDQVRSKPGERDKMVAVGDKATQRRGGNKNQEKGKNRSLQQARAFARAETGATPRSRTMGGNEKNAPCLPQPSENCRALSAVRTYITHPPSTVLAAKKPC